MIFDALFKQSQQNKEDWRYTDLRAYEKVLFSNAPEVTSILPEAIASQRLVFVNGHYRADLSSIEGLPEHFLVQDSGGQCCLTLGEKTCLALQPLELLYMSCSQDQPWEGQSKVQLRLGENSRLTLLERFVYEGEDLLLHAPHLEIALAKQAKLVHGRLITGAQASVHLAHVHVAASEGAFYDHFVLVTGGGLVRNETDVSLNGELASAHLEGVSLQRGASRADLLARVSHMAPYGTSRQLFKSVLDERAKGTFQGKIYVHETAQKTDSHQLSRALLLSDQAEMNAKPELEIYADDVKCSHGSAIGDLDEKELFYLRSRGIDKTLARAMLIEAFVQETIDRLQSKEIAGLARAEVQKWLSSTL